MEIRLTGATRRLEALQAQLADRCGLVARLYESRSGKDARLYLHVDEDAATAMIERLAAHQGADEEGSR